LSFCQKVIFWIDVFAEAFHARPGQKKLIVEKGTIFSDAK
jgi:hypothetical protein